jgi:hypothetical protein
MELAVFSHPTLVTLTSELSPQRLRFDATSVRVGTVVGKGAMRHFSPSTSVLLVVIPPMFCTITLLLLQTLHNFLKDSVLILKTLSPVNAPTEEYRLKYSDRSLVPVFFLNVGSNVRVRARARTHTHTQTHIPTNQVYFGRALPEPKIWYKIRAPHDIGVCVSSKSYFRARSNARSAEKRPRYGRHWANVNKVGTTIWAIV